MLIIHVCSPLAGPGVGYKSNHPPPLQSPQPSVTKHTRTFWAFCSLYSKFEVSSK